MCVGSRAAARSNGDSPSLIPSRRNSPSSSPRGPSSSSTDVRPALYLSLFRRVRLYRSVSVPLPRRLSPFRSFFQHGPSLSFTSGASGTDAFLYSFSLLLANDLFFVTRLSRAARLWTVPRHFPLPRFHNFLFCSVAPRACFCFVIIVII